MTHGHLGADPEQAPALRFPGHPAVALTFLLSLLVMLFAAGCAMGPKPESPALDLHTAKSTTMANERDMIAIIPAGDIVETKQNQVSNLLGCSGGRHLWTGQINVFLAPGADGPGYVQKIKAAWMGRTPFGRRRDSGSGPRPHGKSCGSRRAPAVSAEL